MNSSIATKVACGAAAAFSVLTLAAPAASAAPAAAPAAAVSAAVVAPFKSDDPMARAIAQRAAVDPVFRAQLEARIRWEVVYNPNGAIANGVRAALRANIRPPSYSQILSQYRYATQAQYRTFLSYWYSGFQYPHLAFGAG